MLIAWQAKCKGKFSLCEKQVRTSSKRFFFNGFSSGIRSMVMQSNLCKWCSVWWRRWSNRFSGLFNGQLTYATKQGDEATCFERDAPFQWNVSEKEVNRIVSKVLCHSKKEKKTDWEVPTCTFKHCSANQRTKTGILVKTCFMFFACLQSKSSRDHY